MDRRFHFRSQAPGRSVTFTLLLLCTTHHFASFYRHCWFVPLVCIFHIPFESLIGGAFFFVACRAGQHLEIQPGKDAAVRTAGGSLGTSSGGSTRRSRPLFRWPRWPCLTGRPTWVGRRPRRRGTPRSSCCGGSCYCRRALSSTVTTCRYRADSDRPRERVSCLFG